MRSRYQARQPDAAYFVTSTVIQWLPVFTTSARCDILVEALAYCREHKGLRITAWVILDNHFHAILAAPDLPRVMADLKRHTAKQMIAQLQAERCEWLLHSTHHHSMDAPSSASGLSGERIVNSSSSACAASRRSNGSL